MGGQDETQARAILVAMQERLAGGPHAALGLSPGANAAEVRAAFLQLAKTFHPQRFGRMSSEVQRLSNEVFLALRAAHDTIARPTRGGVRSERSGPFPAVGGAGSRPVAAPSSAGSSGSFAASPASAPPAPTAAPALRPGTGPQPRLTPAPMAAVAPPPMTPSPMTPPRGVRVGAVRPVPATPRAGVAATPPAAVPVVPAATRTDELAPIFEYLQRGQWQTARAALTGLLTRSPDHPRYRALLSYARGREAQLAQRIDEARVELQDALQLDPDLQLAKTALAELFTRRK